MASGLRSVLSSEEIFEKLRGVLWPCEDSRVIWKEIGV